MLYFNIDEIIVQGETHEGAHPESQPHPFSTLLVLTVGIRKPIRLLVHWFSHVTNFSLFLGSALCVSQKRPAGRRCEFSAQFAETA